MSVRELMALLRSKHIELAVEGGNLRVSGNKAALADASLTGEMRAHKQALIEAVERGEYANPSAAGAVAVPPNLIPANCSRITPDMLTLVTLDQAQIDRIVASVDGGAANVQDIYPLGPLQQGIYFHHRMQMEGDVYLLHKLTYFDSRDRMEQFQHALQAVIQRHDAMRTAYVDDGLPEPVQVVWRTAKLQITELALDPQDGDIAAQLQARFDLAHNRLDLRQAPVWRQYVAFDAPNHRWVALDLFHHLMSDHHSGTIVHEELQAHLLGQEASLPAPVPFRNFIAQSRLGVSQAEHEAFFRQMLAKVDETCAPFGMVDASGDGSRLREVHLDVSDTLSARLRSNARTHGVSAASICHVVWAMVLARLSARDEVVFGTLLFGRMRAGEGADRVMGMFINTLPICIEVGELSARASLRAAHETLGGLILHEHAPLTLAQRCSGVAAPAPLFTTHLNYRYDPGHEPSAEEAESAARAWHGIRSEHETERTNYPLGLAVNDLSSGFSFDLQADESIDAQRILALVLTAFDSLLAALEQDSPLPLRELAVLDAVAMTHLLALGAGPQQAPTWVTGGLYGLFASQAQRDPEATAIEDDTVTLSYRDLLHRANGMAQSLALAGVGAGQRVAILCDRSAEAMTGVLGVLGLGAAYVPIDPALPDERIAFMLQGVAAILAPRRLLTRMQSLQAGVPCLVIGDQAAAAGLPPLSDIHPDLAAYVIYTSGSTGVPKGVVVGQGSVMSFVHGFIATHAFAGQRLLMIPPLIFDASVGDIFPALATGAALILHPAPTELDAEGIATFCEARAISAIDAPAALWRRWIEGFAAGLPGRAVLPGVNLIMFGGEAVPVEQVRRFAAMTENRIVLANHYGPTEATVCASLFATRDASECTGVELPIGRPLPGVQLYVLDQHRRLAPRGVEGQLYIGGDGVACGYLDHPESTAERFLPDPFSDVPGARMYETGDLARWLPDGNIAYLGRNDFQVKIRGFRIELGEIEMRLAACEGIREASVIAREDGPGIKRLVAYFVAADGMEPAAAALRAQLALDLPDYMLPTAFVRLSAFPLTPNGKLDRKALPAPDKDALISRAYEAPIGPAETTMATIWRELLQVERVGRHDDFFELGGNSLVAMQLAVRVRDRMHIELPIAAIFAAPSLSAMAQAAFAQQLDTYLDTDIAAAEAELDALSDEDLRALYEQENANE